MFQDIKVSEDLNQQFKEQYRSTKGSIAGEWLYAVKWIFLFTSVIYSIDIHLIILSVVACPMFHI
jgi:cytochrome c biogenesis protein ResB